MSELIDRTDGSIPCIFSILVIGQVFFFEEIYYFFLKKCNLNTPPGQLIFSNIFRRSIFLFQRYHYFVIGIQLMFIQ